MMKKEINKSKIFEAALKLFAHYGYKKTTLEDVASQVGMTKSNLYFYVTNKKDLYEQTIGNALINWRNSVALAIEKKTDVLEKFFIMATASYAYLKNHDELRSILIMDPNIFTLSKQEDRFYDINQGAMQLVKDILAQGIEQDIFYDMDVDHTAELFFSIYIMFLIKTYIKSEGNSAAKMYEQGLQIIMRGLCKDASKL